MLSVILTSGFCLLTSVRAASFPGNARVEITDPTGGLSWSNSVNALTVSCWFKFVIPSGTNINQHMTLLVNRKTGTETTDPYAYLIRYNIWNGNLEFVTRGTSIATNTLIERPYLERWYHLAVVRQGDEYTGYVDGRQVFNNTRTIGSTVSSNGVSIGDWNGTTPFWGEIQEVAIYQAALSQEFITWYMYQDQPDIPELKGYYKLGWSANSADYYKNFSSSPPTGTETGTKVGTGEIRFEEVNQAGEQSLFDSRKNAGSGAMAPLAGAFTWSQGALSRPTPGIGFGLQFGYSSANAVGGYQLGTYDPFTSGAMGKGWRHSFEMRVLPGQYFSPVAGIDTIGVMSWDGGIETWDLDYDSFEYYTRHNEYRGELDLLGNTCQWTTPDRLIYKFRHPFSGSTIMRGRLMEVRDYNGNSLKLHWNETIGILTQVVDTVGGQYDFRYNSQYLLTNVTFQGWSANFQYNATNQLVAKWFTAPAAYSNLNTRWSYSYYATNGLLSTVTDPNSNTAVRVFYDQWGRKTNVVDALNRSTQTAYVVSGNRQITRTDPGGFAWVENYDRKGRVISRTDPLTNTVAYAYDDRGNVSNVTEPLGWKTYFAYDERSNRIAQTNELGQITRWVYHSFFNKPIEAINPLNWSTHFEYDAAGNLTRSFDDLGTLSSATYFPNGLVATATDANGNVSQFAYNSDGFLTAKTDPANNTWNYTRNELGWTLTTTDPLSQTATLTYNVNGNVIKTVDPLNRTFTATYDPNGNLLTKSDAKAQLTRFYYDAANQQTQMVDRVRAVWKTTYTTRGSVNQTIDPYNNTVTRTYDNANRLIKVTDPLSQFASTEYDANGNVTATVDKLNRRWTKEYNRLNRVIRSTNPLGNVTRTSYDAAGRVETVTAPKGYVSRNYYDGRGRLTKWKDAGGFDWLYTYDGNGNITDITDALSGHYLMTYGSRNERLTEKNQDNKTWNYRYDKLLRLDQQTDPKGIVRTITYDAGSRIDYVSFGTGRTDDYSYDDNNNPTTLSRSAPAQPPTGTTLGYDAMDRVTSYTDAFGKNVGYSLDQMGRIAQVNYPGGFWVTNRFDALSRLTRQTDSAGRQMNYSYDKADRLLTRKYPNGIIQTNTFDYAGRLTSLQHLASSNSVQLALSYAYDKNGNRESSGEQGTLKWALPSAINATMRYTPSGRLIDRLDAADTNRNTTFAYDQSENMTSSLANVQDYTFTYDEDNRVATVFYDYKLPVQFDRLIVNRYDALGRRVARTIDGAETRYVLDLTGGMEEILCDTTASGVISNYYVHGPGGLGYRVDSGGNYLCYHADGSANIIALTDAGATNVAQYAYSPYGRLLGTHPSSFLLQPFLFVGSLGVMEELPNLYFMRARYYSAETASFASRDPIGGVGGGRAFGSYIYAANNPVTKTDPHGLFSLDPVDVASAAWGAVGAVAGAANYAISHYSEIMPKGALYAGGYGQASGYLVAGGEGSVSVGVACDAQDPACPVILSATMISPFIPISQSIPMLAVATGKAGYYVSFSGGEGVGGEVGLTGGVEIGFQEGDRGWRSMEGLSLCLGGGGSLIVDVEGSVCGGPSGDRSLQLRLGAGPSGGGHASASASYTFVFGTPESTSSAVGTTGTTLTWSGIQVVGELSTSVDPADYCATHCSSTCGAGASAQQAPMLSTSDIQKAIYNKMKGSGSTHGYTYHWVPNYNPKPNNTPPSNPNK
jgi:RHS repeat-associated protein